MVRRGSHRDVVQANLATSVNQSRANPLSEVQGIASAFHDEGFSVDELVSVTGKSPGWVDDRLKIAQASPVVQQCLGEAEIAKGTLSDEASKRLERSWKDAHGGLGKAHGVAVLEKGTKWERVGLSNQDAQFLDTRSFQIEEMARWFGVPLHRIGHTEKATSWGTGIEQFNLGYLMFTLIPWLKRWEQLISKDLILRPETFFVEFLMDHLMRGDITSRYRAYGIAIDKGWLNPNEVREKENENPVEGLDGYRIPQNMATIDKDGKVHPANQRDDRPANPSPSTPPPTGRDSRARLLALQAAGRVVRKETAAVGRAVSRYAGDAEGYEAWSQEFWTDHVNLLAEALHLDDATASEYIETNRDLDLEQLEETVDARIVDLAAMALGEVKEVAGIH